MASLGQINSYKNSDILKEYQSLANQPSEQAVAPRRQSLAQDIGVGLAKGAVSLGSVPVGLADMIPGVKASTYLKDKIGYDTSIAHQMIDEGLSDEAKQQQANLSKAMQGGVASTIQGAIGNPRAVLGNLAQSAPLMATGLGVGGIVTRAGLGLTEALGVGSLAEGAMTTGMQAHEDQSNGIPYEKYAPNDAAAGALTAAISFGSGRLFGDIGTNLVSGKGAGMGMLKALGVEGGEEVAQSYQEKVFQNRTNDRPLTEGAAGEGTLGGILGAAMGGGLHLASHSPTNPMTGKPTGKEEIVHPSTGDLIANKDVKTAYTTYRNAFDNIKDPNSEGYKTAMSNANALLDKIHHPEGENATPHPKDAEDAKAIQELISKAHSSLETEASKNVVEPIAPEPIAPESVAPTPQEEIISTPTDTSHIESSDSLPLGAEERSSDSSLTVTDTPTTPEEIVKSINPVEEGKPTEPITSEEIKDEPTTEAPKIEEAVPPTEVNTVQEETANTQNISTEEGDRGTETKTPTKLQSVSYLPITPEELDKWTPEIEKTHLAIEKGDLDKLAELRSKIVRAKVLNDQAAAPIGEPEKVHIATVETTELPSEKAYKSASPAVKAYLDELPSTKEVLSKYSNEDLTKMAIKIGRGYSSTPEYELSDLGLTRQELKVLHDKATTLQDTSTKAKEDTSTAPESTKVELTPGEVVTKVANESTRSAENEVIQNEINDVPSKPEVFAEATKVSERHDTVEALTQKIANLSMLGKMARGQISDSVNSKIDLSVLGKDTISKEDLPKIMEMYKEATARKAELLGMSDKTAKLGKKTVDTSLSSSEVLEDGSTSELHFDANYNPNVNVLDTAVQTADHSANLMALNKFQNMAGKFIKQNGIKIYYAKKWADHTFPEGAKFDKIDHRQINAWIHTSKDGSKVNIYIHGQNYGDQKSLIGTMAHELIGHYGVAKVLGGQDKYNMYLSKVLNNKEVLKDVLALNKRWKVYLDTWNSKNDITKLAPEHIFEHEGVKIPRRVAMQLADEYMAELAKAQFFDKQFLEKAVGMGIRFSPERSAIRSKRDSILKEYMAKIRHFFKSVFGNHFDTYTHDELVAVIAKSTDRIFDNLNADHLDYETNEDFVKPGWTKAQMRYTATNENSGAYDIDPQEVLDVEQNIPIETGLLNNINQFVTAVESNYGQHTDTFRSKSIARFNEKVKATPLLAAMTTFGNMPYQKSYAAIDTMFKGKMAVVEKNPGAIASVLNTLDPLKNQLVFDYFTTKGYDINTIPLTPIQRNVIKNAKEAIREVGKALYDLGAIPEESFNKYDDAYLHLVYLEYLNQYKGSNKTPFMGWAKKRKDLDAGAKLALGMIKDVKFLVPETLGIMSRDHTLLGMFKTISQVSADANTHWVMHDDTDIKYLGVPMDLEEAIKQSERNHFVMNQHLKVNKNTFEGSDTEMLKLSADTSALDNSIKNSQAVIAQQLEQAYQKSLALGHTKVANKEEFLKENYIQMPDTVKQGALRGRYVRKEIYKDLQSLNSAYTFGDKSDIEKFFAEGGTMDRMNRFWKLTKVGLNPASWARNFLGNFSLLDLSTSTNRAKLIGMLHEEMSGLYSGKQTDYWRLAEKHGLFGVTFSAMELQILHNTYSKELTKSQKDFGSKAATPHDGALHFLDERMMHFMDMGKQSATDAISKAGISTSKMYGLMEGLFKTVAFKDYIQTWEAQNNVSLNSLPPEKQQIVTIKAAANANDAIFDYSKVPASVRFLRTTPLGMPFLTFTYKAFPASIKAMINHPMKFAQYAALPSLLTMLAAGMNDWDDDDVNKINSQMSDYYRNNSGVAILPWKDKSGRAQLINLDFLFPWSQHIKATRILTDSYQDNGPVGAIGSISESARALGVLGGPLPQTITAMTTGINSFTGKPIMTPGASPTQQITDLTKYSWDLATPSWLSSTGWVSKMYNTFKDKPSVDRFGDIKFTAGQAVSDITGLGAKPISEHGQQNRRLYYTNKIREINTYRSTVIKDRNNIEDRPTLLKDISVRLKMIRSQMAEEFKQ